tara:strand:- start:277 stop:495 length:219 start_codon:yes stop_codon:yes gene_type:complete
MAAGIVLGAIAIGFGLAILLSMLEWIVSLVDPKGYENYKHRDDRWFWEEKQRQKELEHTAIKEDVQPKKPYL